MRRKQGLTGFLLLASFLTAHGDTDQCLGTPATVADGSCDKENNIAGCSYDGGDCCRCTCLEGLEYECGSKGFDCRNPASLNVFHDCREEPGSLSPCPFDSPQQFEVNDTASATVLAEMARCSGGTFEVAWRGTVAMDRAIYISNGTTVHVTGVGSEAILQGGGNSRMFTVDESTLYLSNVILANGSAAEGGAIAALSSTVYLHQASFRGNTAAGDGGALLAVRHSNISIVGSSSFVENTAGSCGGALCVRDSSIVSLFQDTLSTLNAHEGSVFSGNRALSGGAVYVAAHSHIDWDADITFSGNAAENTGGAMFISSGSGVSWTAKISFTGNTAEEDGGALYINHGNDPTTPPFLKMHGPTSFLCNQCVRNGGALAIATESALRFGSEDIVFEKNSAGAYGGAVFLSGLAIGPRFQGVTFISNTADVGGAVSVVSSGTALGEDTLIGRTLFSTTFDRCRFLHNQALSDGGAVHTHFGSCAVEGSYFNGNTATRGGAVYLASSASLQNCTFIENRSGEQGGHALCSPAGFNPEMSDISFVDNVLRCYPGRCRRPIPEDNLVRQRR